MTSWCSVRGARIGKTSIFCFFLFTVITFVSGFWLSGSLILALDALFAWMKEFCAPAEPAKRLLTLNKRKNDKDSKKTSRSLRKMFSQVQQL